MSASRPEIEVDGAQNLRAWLRANHASSEAVWLVSFKKAAGARYLPYNAIVEELLAFGWIDSKPGKVDALRSKLLIAPRKPTSAWSKANRDRIAALEASGRMQPAGRAAVAAAKANGAWEKLRASETGRAPPDLVGALAAGGARTGWEGLTLATRKRALEWLSAAKRPKTRAARIAKIVATAAAGEDPTAWKPKP